ncbi:MAG: HlyD family efflux transporter periplasmic adaptor subunit [Bacillota bacterium]|nr:HlyD family efflux transporter periplasmic adaptor subunit [Bacillota bacterium]
MKKKGTRDVNRHFKVLPGEGKRFSFSNFKQAFIFYVLLLLALVIIVQLGYHWLGEQYLAWRLQIINSEPGIMIQECRVAGLVTRDEAVIRAPESGLIMDLAENGERIAAGSDVAAIGIISPLEMQRIRGGESEEYSEEDLWEQFKEYWQQFFEEKRNNSQDEIVASSESGTDDSPGTVAINPSSMTFKDTVDVYSENSGLISHYTDGWEDYRGSLYLSAEEFAEVYDEGEYAVVGELIDAGQPLVKIVNNWRWYYSIKLPLHPGQVIAGKDTAEIEFDFAPGDRVRGKLYHKEEKLQEVFLTYEIEEQIEGFEQIRWAEATLLYSRREGIIIPEEALFEKEGREGIFVIEGGRVIFKPVSLVERQENRLLVEGIDPGNLVITKPAMVEEGQRLN